MQTQYVTDDNGEKVAVILPLDQYKKMIEDIEELEDIKLYDEAKNKKQEFLDADQAFKEIEESR